MIPNFPNFAKLEKTHKKSIQLVTKKFDPYSDFNFVSLITWNTDGNTHISKFHDNLVIRMKDYSSDGTIYSFLGNNNVINTIHTLLKHAQESNNPKLMLIPHVNIAGNAEIEKHFNIQEDRDQFDYVYDVEKLKNLQNADYKKKRNMIKKFHSQKPDTVVKILDLSNSSIVDEVTKLIHAWHGQRNEKQKEINSDELVALQNALQLSHEHPLIAVGIYHEDTLIGFSLSEILHNNFAIVHYEKTIPSMPGTTEFLIMQTARILHEHGVKWINYEQDLGKEGLRISKTLWRPSHFLKKYTITSKLL